MSPRPYRLGRREAATEETRGRVITAARALLAAPDGAAAFSMEAVARQADVARMTVYYQFGSRRGLLEALFDDLAARGQLAEHLAAAFQRPIPLDALDGLIAAFVGFWAADRLVMRRLRSLAALDADFAQGIQARDERRRQAVRALLARLTPRPQAPPAPLERPLVLPEASSVPAEGPPARPEVSSVPPGASPAPPEGLRDVADLLFTLTSFETFDSLAADPRTPAEVTRLLQRLARTVLIWEQSPGA